MKLTDAELRAMPPKAVRFADEVALYREHDFLTAYGMHTDKRIRETGPKAAIGGGDNWNEHGRLQFDFLRRRGLTPDHRLLEIGCGTGRLARHVVPFLDPGHYVGVDISADAIREATVLSGIEGWGVRYPEFLHLSWPRAKFDYLWAFSVFIHLPPAEIVRAMRAAAACMHPSSSFYWSFVPEAVDARTGLKQFRATLKTYQRCAADAGLTFDEVPNWVTAAGHQPGRWSGAQRVAASMLVP